MPKGLPAMELAKMRSQQYQDRRVTGVERSGRNKPANPTPITNEGNLCSDSTLTGGYTSPLAPRSVYNRNCGILWDRASVPNGPGRPIGRPRLRGQAGPGRHKKSLGRPRPLFRWPMKPMGPTGRPIGLTGVNRAKNKRNFGCVWPPVTTKAARPTRCGSIEQPLGLFRPNVPVLRRIRVFRFVTSPFFSRYIFSSSL